MRCQAEQLLSAPRGPATASDIGNNKRCIGNLFTRSRAAAFVSVWRRAAELQQCGLTKISQETSAAASSGPARSDLMSHEDNRRQNIWLHLKSQLQLMSGLSRNCEGTVMKHCANPPEAKTLSNTSRSGRNLIFMHFSHFFPQISILAFVIVKPIFLPASSQGRGLTGNKHVNPRLFR